MRGCRTLELLVIQPTPFCNIDCSYCYLPQRTSKELMSDETLEALFDNLMSSRLVSDDLTIAWHAGEPLAAGIDFYDRAFSIINRTNVRRVRINHNIQTNGLLLDQNWIRFLRGHQVQLGLSIDGPQRFHDAYRKTRSGAGTFNRVMRAVHLLHDNGFPFHVISVLTVVSLAAADEFFQFYVNNGIKSVGFNFEEIEGEHVQSSLRAVDTEKVRHFFARLLRLVDENQGKLYVREFAEARNLLTHRCVAEMGNSQATALRIISVGVNGELSTFSPELLGCQSETYGDFVFGTVKNGFHEILRDPAFIKAERDIRSGVAICKRGCEYFNVCLGGAPSNKLFENGTFVSGETDYCRFSKKAVVDVVLAAMESELGIAQ
jgi:uncharacterized protein